MQSVSKEIVAMMSHVENHDAIDLRMAIRIAVASITTKHFNCITYKPGYKLRLVIVICYVQSETR